MSSSSPRLTGGRRRTLQVVLMAQRMPTLLLLSVFLRSKVGLNGAGIGTWIHRIHCALRCLLKAFFLLVDAFVKARLCSPPSLDVGGAYAWSEGEMVGRGSCQQAVP